MQRGIDLIFIISLTFRRGKLGLVCASLMLPITSSLLKPPNESRRRPPGRGRDGRLAVPTTLIKAYLALHMGHNNGPISVLRRHNETG